MASSWIAVGLFCVLRLSAALLVPGQPRLQEEELVQSGGRSAEPRAALAVRAASAWPSGPRGGGALEEEAPGRRAERDLERRAPPASGTGAESTVAGWRPVGTVEPVLGQARLWPLTSAAGGPAVGASDAATSATGFRQLVQAAEDGEQPAAAQLHGSRRHRKHVVASFAQSSSHHILDRGNVALFLLTLLLLLGMVKVLSWIQRSPQSCPDHKMATGRNEEAPEAGARFAPGRPRGHTPADARAEPARSSRPGARGPRPDAMCTAAGAHADARRAASRPATAGKLLEVLAASHRREPEALACAGQAVRPRGALSPTTSHRGSVSEVPQATCEGAAAPAASAPAAAVSRMPGRSTTPVSAELPGAPGFCLDGEEVVHFLPTQRIAARRPDY